jgi:hypothetical protein
VALAVFVGTPTQVFNNTALANNTDLFDNNPMCSGDCYSNNVFFSHSPNDPCIR